MLLIGSRAIVHYFPDFRPPLDWDLFGSSEEIRALSKRLPPLENTVVRPHKACFQYDSAIVEVVNTDVAPEWAKIVHAFRNEASIEEPVLGTLIVAPAAFLMITKQVGLIYDIWHWHKNLEDLYFLRDRISSVPDVVTQVMPHSLEDSRKLFAASTAHVLRSPPPCHAGEAEQSPNPRTALHAELHQILAEAGTPLVNEKGAWQGYPDAQPEARRAKMVRLFAEEAMVIGAEQLLTRGLSHASDDEQTVTRWAMRMLITGSLPEGWRYFGVNYYREIMAAIPRGWTSRLSTLETPIVRHERQCHEDSADAICQRQSGGASACERLGMPTRA